MLINWMLLYLILNKLTWYLKDIKGNLKEKTIKEKKSQEN